VFSQLSDILSSVPRSGAAIRVLLECPVVDQAAELSAADTARITEVDAMISQGFPSPGKGSNTILR
jgi:hypothetical protein